MLWFRLGAVVALIAALLLSISVFCSTFVMCVNPSNTRAMNTDPYYNGTLIFYVLVLLGELAMAGATLFGFIVAFRIWRNNHQLDHRLRHLFTLWLAALGLSTIIVFILGILGNVRYREPQEQIVSLYEIFAKYNQDVKFVGSFERYQRENSCCGINGPNDWMMAQLKSGGDSSMGGYGGYSSFDVSYMGSPSTGKCHLTPPTIPMGCGKKLLEEIQYTMMIYSIILLLETMCAIASAVLGWYCFFYWIEKEVIIIPEDEVSNLIVIEPESSTSTIEPSTAPSLPSGWSGSVMHSGNGSRLSSFSRTTNGNGYSRESMHTAYPSRRSYNGSNLTHNSRNSYRSGSGRYYPNSRRTVNSSKVTKLSNFYGAMPSVGGPSAAYYYPDPDDRAEFVVESNRVSNLPNDIHSYRSRSRGVVAESTARFQPHLGQFTGETLQAYDNRSGGSGGYRHRSRGAVESTARFQPHPAQFTGQTLHAYDNRSGGSGGYHHRSRGAVESMARFQPHPAQFTAQTLQAYDNRSRGSRGYLHGRSRSYLNEDTDGYIQQASRGGDFHTATAVIRTQSPHPKVKKKHSFNHMLHKQEKALGGKVLAEMHVDHVRDPDPVNSQMDTGLATRGHRAHHATIAIIKNKATPKPKALISGPEPGHGQTGHLAEDILEMSGAPAAKSLIDDLALPVEHDANLAEGPGYVKKLHKAHKDKGQLDHPDPDHPGHGPTHKMHGIVSAPSVDGSQAQSLVDTLLNPKPKKKVKPPVVKAHTANAPIPTNHDPVVTSNDPQPHRHHHNDAMGHHQHKSGTMSHRPHHSQNSDFGRNEHHAGHTHESEHHQHHSGTMSHRTHHSQHSGHRASHASGQQHHSRKTVKTEVLYKSDKLFD